MLLFCVTAHVILKIDIKFGTSFVMSHAMYKILSALRLFDMTIQTVNYVIIWHISYK